MKFLALAALLLSLNAHATGGFSCQGLKADGEKVELFGTTGRVPGNPLVSDVMMTVGDIETAQVFPKDQVVGYWSMGKSIKLAIVDSNAEEIILKLSVKTKKDEDALTGKLTIPGGEKLHVSCILE
ncbi:MAG: hypothetical protein CME70_24070 [Halobacteriovorax sp.]|nr:hypothetical protein [Halobacteriovorax sp.]|tara:strand:+ start:222 stop:599 length:378 start_codon:yes stop_codon:yes gene_type:complete